MYKVIKDREAELYDLFQRMEERRGRGDVRTQMARAAWAEVWRMLEIAQLEVDAWDAKAI